MNFINLDSKVLLSIFYIFGNVISIFVCLMLYINNRKSKQELIERR